MAETAYVSLHYGWSLEESLDLEHPDRRYFIERLAIMNAADDDREDGRR